MRVLMAIVIMFGAGLVLSGTPGTQAGEKAGKEVTLKGTITCAKCDLKVAKKCATVIVTKLDGKKATVYFDKDSNKTHHASICTEAKEGSVTGTLKDDGKKKVIAVKTLKFKE